jgi:ABC-type transporter Mla MlaB component
MNRMVRGMKSFLARRTAHRMDIRMRRFRRALRDEHREALRCIRNAERRARGLRLYAAWCGPKRAAVSNEPILLPWSIVPSNSSVEEGWTAAGTPFSLEFGAANGHAHLINGYAGDGVRVRAEINERIVLIDLNEVTCIESGSIAMLIEGMNLIAARGGRMAIIGVREDVRRVFKATRLDKVFRIFSSREEALSGQA